MKARTRMTVLVLVLVLLVPALQLDGDADLPSIEGPILEQFEFHLTWIGIRVGTGILELRRNGERRYFTSLARSVDWVSRLYPVNNFAFTVMDDEGLPLHYRNMQSEGRYRSHKETIFEEGRVRHTDHTNGRSTQYVTDVRYHDVLSAFLTSRRVELVPGRSVFIDVFDDGKGKKVEIAVLRRETIDTAFGKTAAVVIEPRLDSDGLFRHTGPMRIWISEDERRLPLRLEASVMLGAVRASLVGGIF